MLLGLDKEIGEDEKLTAYEIRDSLLGITTT
jgi:hypothetical protein